MIESDPSVDVGMSRRDLLRAGAGGALGVSSLSLLAACGGASKSTSTSVAHPTRGGTLTIAALSGGTAETLNPPMQISNTDLARCLSLYDGLFRSVAGTPGAGYDVLQGTNNAIAKVEPALAESAEPNGDASVWTVRLRDGVTWHDGKSLTADDLIYTIRHSWLNPIIAPLTKLLIDAQGVRKRDKLTVEIPLVTPVAGFPGVTSLATFLVVQDGAKDFSKPVGTGPFKFESFTPGTRSVFTANDNYFLGRPYVDSLVVDSTFTDENSRVNAVASGAADIAPSMAFALARGSNGVRVQIGKGANPYWFGCRVDQAPFKDPRVMTALKLLTDRAAMVESVFSGYATQGNDLPMAAMLEAASAFPVRPHDVDQAKSLLKAAGHEGLHLTLYTGPVFDGSVESATLLKQQFAEGGVTLSVKQLPASVYYSTSGGGNYLGYPMDTATPGGGSWNPTIPALYLETMWTKAPYNDTHWGSHSDDKLFLDALGELDPAKATDKWHTFMNTLYDRGGTIVYASASYVDGFGQHVSNIPASGAGPCNNFDFRTASKAKTSS